MPPARPGSGHQDRRRRSDDLLHLRRGRGQLRACRRSRRHRGFERGHGLLHCHLHAVVTLRPVSTSEGAGNRALFFSTRKRRLPRAACRGGVRDGTSPVGIASGVPGSTCRAACPDLPLAHPVGEQAASVPLRMGGNTQPKGATSTCSSPTNGDSSSSSNNTTSRTRKRLPPPKNSSSPTLTLSGYVASPTSEPSERCNRPLA